MIDDIQTNVTFILNDNSISLHFFIYECEFNFKFGCTFNEWLEVDYFESSQHSSNALLSGCKYCLLYIFPSLTTANIL